MSAVSLTTFRARVTSASTIKESWIPKSAANVAQTDKPEIPAGFRQVPPSPAFN